MESKPDVKKHFETFEFPRGSLGGVPARGERSDAPGTPDHPLGFPAPKAAEGSRNTP